MLATRSFPSAQTLTSAQLLNRTVRQQRSGLLRGVRAWLLAAVSLLIAGLFAPDAALAQVRPRNAPPSNVSFFSTFQSYTQNQVSYAQAIAANAAGGIYYSGTYNLGYVPVDANGIPIVAQEQYVNGVGSLIMGMTLDSANNLYRADAGGGNVQMYTFVGPAATQFANGNAPTNIGSGWTNPSGIAVDGSLNVYVLDGGASKLVELSPNGSGGFTQTTLLTDATHLKYATGLSRDSAGNFYFTQAPYNSGRETEFTASGIVAGVWKLEPISGAYTTAGISAIGSGWVDPVTTAVDLLGNVWVSDFANGSGEIVLLTPVSTGYAQSNFQQISTLNALGVNKVGEVYGFAYASGTAEIWAGGSAPHSLGTYPVGTAAPIVPVRVSFPSAMTLNSYSVLTQGFTGGGIADAGTGDTCTVGNSYSAGATCIVNIAFTPQVVGLTTGEIVVNGSVSSGSNYFFGFGTAPVLDFLPGKINTISGDGTACTSGICGDGGSIASASFATPTELVFDTKGNGYVPDGLDQTIRKVSGGNISTVVGTTGSMCPSGTSTCGDGGQGTSATVHGVSQVALDGAGNLYFTDTNDNRVRVYNTQTGVVSAFAGTGTPCSNPTAASNPCGDNGPASSAQLTIPEGLAVDSYGNVYIGDSGDHRVREVNVATGIITTIAGTGVACTSSSCGDGGLATAGQINLPVALSFDPNGNLYIADPLTDSVREVALLTGNISTVAGTTGTACTSSTGACGDGGAATSAQLSGPAGIAVDSAGNLFIADTLDNKIRLVNASTGTISTLAGTGLACPTSTASPACGDTGSPLSATLTTPSFVSIDNSGNVIVGDTGDYRIREIAFPAPSFSFATTAVGSTSTDSPQGVTVFNEGSLALTLSLNAAITTNFTIDSTSSCAQTNGGTIAVGANCTYAVDFKPTTTSTSTGTLTLTDNNLTPSVTTTTQVINLSGTATNANAATAIAFLNPPTPSITAGGNAGSAVTVEELNSSNTLASTATDTITLTVTGPGGYTATYTATAVGGIATFNLSSAALTATGGYTYTATLGTDTPAVASETVTAGAAVSFSGSGPETAGQSTVIGTAYLNSFAVLVKDAYGNPVQGTTVTFSVPTSGPSAVLSATTARSVSNGVAFVTGTANGIVGNFTVTATINGISGSVTFPVTNTKATPAVTLVATPATPIVYGSAQTVVKGTVADSAVTTTPTGSLSFFNNTSTALGSATQLAGGTASYTGYLPAGVYSLTASYGGDSNFNLATTAAPTAYTVTKAPVTVTASTTQTVPAGSTTATVGVTITGASTGTGILVPGAASAATVTCTFYSGTTVVGTSTVAVVTGTTNSTAACPVPSAVTATSGNYTVTAAFSGDNDYTASGSGTGGGSGNSLNFPITVQPTAPTITWAPPSSATTVTYGTSLAATLTAAATINGVSVPGTYTYSASTVGAVTGTSVLGVGTYTITVTFTPTSSLYQTVTSTITYTVTKATPGVRVTSSANPVFIQTTVTYTATVTGTATVPGGTVTFYDGTTALGSSNLSGTGVATITSTPTSTGTHPITATYNGSTLYNTATSSAFGELAEDFSVTATGTTAVTVNPNNTVSYTFAVAPVSGTVFPAAIALTPSGGSSSLTLSLAPTTIASGAGTTNLTLTVGIPATVLAQNRGPDSPNLGRRLAPLSVALLFLPLLGKLRRTRRQIRRKLRGGLTVIMMLLIGVAATSLSGCGVPTGYFGQQPETYTLTVTGVSGTLSHSASVTLTVE
jgi:hypothetical protein